MTSEPEASSIAPGHGNYLAGTPLVLESMRRAVADALGTDPAGIGDDEDLIGRGIDSIRIMQLANKWRRDGVLLRFRDLVQNPNLRAWSTLAAELRVSPPRPRTELRIDETAAFGLAPMQQAYWIGRGENQVLGGVSAHFYAEFDGHGVDPVRLQQAVTKVVRRHGMLRARFLKDGRQQILAESAWPVLTVHDFRSAPAQEAEALRARLSHQRLAVERGEVFDVQLSYLPGNVTRTHINIDMLVSDALSYQIILAELAHFYLRPEADLPPLDYSFQRYLSDQQTGRSGAAALAQAYWQAQLDAMPGAPQLPLAVEPERLVRVGINRRHRWLPGETLQRLSERARAQGLTLPIALMTAFAEVMAAWSAEPRLLLNVPLFDREEVHPDVAGLVGDFTNLVVLSVDTSGDANFAERARRVQRRMQSDMAHAQYSGVEVLRDLARDRPGDWMMAPVVFTSAIGMGELFGSAVRECLGTPAWSTSETPQVWIDHQVIEHDGGLLLNWDVVEELFPDGVVDAMFGAYIDLLDWMLTSDWNEPVPSLLPRDQLAARAAVNATGVPHQPRLLHDGFFAWAAREPDRTALLWSDQQTLSYGKLAERALGVAARLIEDGMRPGDTVGVSLPKGPEQIVAVLGVLAAGGIYLPLGVDQPVLRRRRICESAGARLVLTEAIDDARPLAEPVQVSPTDLAYVIYTSGSTGEPKGVEITHAAAMNTIDEVNQKYGVCADDRVLALSALDFDLSVYDIFGMLSIGGGIVLVTEQDRLEARRWAELMQRYSVSVWNSVPALLEMMLVAGGVQSLKLALVSGDRIGIDLPGQLRAQAPECRFVALGGATEASIWSNAFEISRVPKDWNSIPYGYPLRGQKFRVVDGRGRDCPDFVPGELWIGGAGVARGYRGNDERMSQQFVWHGGERYYRTGDVGRYWPDGTLEFLGRADSQVKIRGHRIELGEIEKVAAAHPNVSSAAATRVAHGRIGAAVIASDDSLDLPGLRVFLAERLPSYMVPDELVVLGDLPLSANGKVDIKALADIIDRSAARISTEEPRGPLETSLAALWTEVLSIAEVGRSQSFLSLGGDSLTATRLIAQVQRRFGVEVTLRHLFAGPTVADLAALIAAFAEGAEEGEL